MPFTNGNQSYLVNTYEEEGIHINFFAYMFIINFVIITIVQLFFLYKDKKSFTKNIMRTLMYSIVLGFLSIIIIFFALQFM